MMIPYGMFKPSGGMSFVNGTTNALPNSTTVDTIDGTMPSGIVAGDLLLAIVTGGGTPTWTLPSGWTLWSTLGSGREISYHIATGSEPASYTWTRNDLTNSMGITVLAFRGVQLDVVGTLSALATSPVAPAITVTQNNSILVVHADHAGAAATYTTPATYTLGAKQESTIPSMGVFYKAGVSSGSTGTVTVTSSSVGTGRGFLFSLKAA